MCRNKKTAGLMGYEKPLQEEVVVIITESTVCVSVYTAAVCLQLSFRLII